MEFSAVICCGLIEVTPDMEKEALTKHWFSAVICCGLIEVAMVCDRPGTIHLFSAVICCGLIEVSAAARLDNNERTGFPQ